LVLIAGNPPQEVFSGLSDNEPGLFAAVSCQRRTIVFPAITSVGLGAHMPPIWALQGLFLFAIPIVCGTSYPIERFYSVNLAVLVIGIAAIAVVLAAPLHPTIATSIHCMRDAISISGGDGVDPRWHEHSDAALAAVGGDEGLAFATAFYSPDQPVFEERLVVPHTEALPRHASFERGWAALCYHGDIGCIASMERIAARDARFVRTEFEVQSTLLGQPGATQRFTALMVPPSDEEKIAPSPPTVVSEDFSARRRTRSRTATRWLLLQGQPDSVSSAASKNERGARGSSCAGARRQRQDDLTILSQYRRCLRPDYLECREVSKIINTSLMRVSSESVRCRHPRGRPLPTLADLRAGYQVSDLTT